MSRWVRVTGASFLTVLGACAGHYDVGDAPDGASGGPEAGAGGSVSTGGSGDDGGTGNVGGSSGGTGGSGLDGGTAGSSGSGFDGGTAGSSGRGAGGSSATGGFAGSPPTSGTGGTSGEASCGAPATYAYGMPEHPVLVWNRIQAVLNNTVPASVPSGLPDETTPAWAASRISAELASARPESGAPHGTRRFMNAWLGVGDDEGAGDTAERAALAFVAEGATFATLTMPEGERTLFEDPALNLLRKGIVSRGQWLLSSVLCVEVDPPSSHEFHVEPSIGATRRQTLEAAIASPACAGCHSIVDPPGYSLEGIDPETGEPRETDNGQPVDASGVFTANSSYFTFSSITDLAPQLAQSCEVATCFVQKVTTDAAAAAALGEFTSEELAAITYEYVESGYAFEALLRAMVRTPTFLE